MTQIYHIYIYSIYHVFEDYVPVKRVNTHEYMSTWVEILTSIESQSKHQIPKNFVLFRFIVTVVLSVANIVKYLDLL